MYPQRTNIQWLWSLLLGGGLLALGAAPLLLPWPLLLLAVPFGMLLVWGLCDVRVALVVLIGTAFFLQAECVVKSHHLVLPLATPAATLDVKWPYLYLAVLLLYVLWHGLGALIAPTRQRPLFAYLAPLGAWWAYAVVSLSWVQNLQWSLIWLLIFTANLIFFWLVYRTADRYERLRQLVVGLVVVGVLHALVIFLFLFLRPLEFTIPVTPQSFLYVQTGGGGLNAEYRAATGGFGRRTFLADFHVTPTVMNIMLALAMGLLISRRHQGAARWTLPAAATLFFFLSVTSDVRSPTIGLFLMVGYWLVCVPRFRARQRLFAGVAVGLIVLFIGADISLRSLMAGEREYPRILSLVMGGKGEVSVGDNMEIRSTARTPLFTEGLRLFRESQGWGGGMENARVPEPEGRGLYVHNLWLSVLQDFGVPGMVCVAWFGWVFLAAFRRLWRAPPSEPREFALTVLGAGVAVLGTSLADFVYDDNFLWPTLGLCAAALSCALASEAFPPGGPAAPRAEAE